MFRRKGDEASGRSAADCGTVCPRWAFVHETQGRREETSWRGSGASGAWTANEGTRFSVTCDISISTYQNLHLRDVNSAHGVCFFESMNPSRVCLQISRRALRARQLRCVRRREEAVLTRRREHEDARCARTCGAAVGRTCECGAEGTNASQVIEANQKVQTGRVTI